MKGITSPLATHGIADSFVVNPAFNTTLADTMKGTTSPLTTQGIVDSTKNK